MILHKSAKLRAQAADKGEQIAFNPQSSFVAFEGRIDARATNITNSADGARLRACAADIIIVGGEVNVSDGASFSSLILGAGDAVPINPDATLLADTAGQIEICGNSSWVTVDPSATISPQPQAIGINQCTSPSSGVAFNLACAQ